MNDDELIKELWSFMYFSPFTEHELKMVKLFPGQFKKLLAAVEYVKSRDQQIALAAREAENEEWVKKYGEALGLLRQHHPEGSATQRALEQVVSDHQNRIATLKENKQ